MLFILTIITLAVNVYNTLVSSKYIFSGSIIDVLHVSSSFSCIKMMYVRVIEVHISSAFSTKIETEMSVIIICKYIYDVI